MSKIEAKIVAHSKNEFGQSIATMVVTFPRIILAEFNTHRIFSRNSASSRAIPFEKMVKSVEENPFIPIAWQKDHKGMQGTKYFTDIDECQAEYGISNALTQIKEWWLNSKDEAIKQAKYLNKADVTKQLVNRLLEPFMWHTVIVTATEWENFFALRCPKYDITSTTPDEFSEVYRSRKDVVKAGFRAFKGKNVESMTDLDWLLANSGQAEIHMMALAEAMWDALNESTPKQLKAGEWHIPFGDNITINNLTGRDIDSFIESSKIKVATARCARISYTVVGEEDKKDNYENDIKLHDRLKESDHMSPFEHCAKAMESSEYENCHYEGNGTCNIQQGWSGNFKGFIQYRKMIPNENIV